MALCSSQGAQTRSGDDERCWDDVPEAANNGVPGMLLVAVRVLHSALVEGCKVGSHRGGMSHERRSDGLKDASRAIARGLRWQTYA